MNSQPKGQLEWLREAWRLRLRLDAPSLEPPAAQYGLFSEDPRGQSSADLAQVDRRHRQMLAEVDDPQRRQALRRIQLATVWSHLFGALRGDQVHLLIPPGGDTALMSNTPAGAKWLVPKPVQIGGRPFCWSVPFEAIAGEEVEVSLAESSLVNLEALDTGPQS